jgi:adenylyltransferase/sulfurtransferase
VEVEPHAVRLSSDNALDVLKGYDVVVDGTDNFPTRYLVNDACVLLGIPNVYGSVFRWEGQVSVFATTDGPCYRCLFREPPPPGLVPNCAEGGVMGALPGIIGTMQAMEALKLVLGTGSSLSGRLMIFDALEMSWREVALRKNPMCPVCGDEPTQTELIDYEVFCGMKPAPSSGADATDAASRHQESGRDKPVEEVAPNTVSALLESEAPPFLLDVRESWEWSVSSLAPLGARLVPLAELGERLSEVPLDRPVVVYCRSGQRSRTAARRLLDHGLTDVRSMRGGLRAWAEQLDTDMRVV